MTPKELITATFKEILKRKTDYYGQTEAAYEFAAEEYARVLLSPHTREVAEKAVDEALDVVFKDCIITDIATDCVEQSGKQFLKDKILARLNPEGK